MASDVNNQISDKKRSWYKAGHETTFYNIRRKLQVLASRIIDPIILSKVYYRIVLGKKLDLVNPKTFNEKLQWLKLFKYSNDELAVQCSDKYAVRKYLEKKGYSDRLVPLLGVWDNASKIDWSKLPRRFVLKCNHGCSYNILCLNKVRLDKEQAVKTLNKWLKEDFGSFNLELHYSKIEKHLVICEECLGEKIYDYKFFCFNGEPKFFYVSYNLIDDGNAEIGFFNFDGSNVPIKRTDYKQINAIELPAFFDAMKRMATDLCADFPFVRVDFFIANDTFYFAELTFIPCAGMMPFDPAEQDLEWGKMLDISKEIKMYIKDER